MSVHAHFLPIWLKQHLALCLCFSSVSPLTLLTFFLQLSLSHCASGFLPLSLPRSLHTAESRLAQSPPPSLGSACRRPTPTTSEASGWPWPRSLASRASLGSISHATRRRQQQQKTRRPPLMRVPPEPPREGGN